VRAGFIGRRASGSEKILRRLSSRGFPLSFLFESGDFGLEKLDPAVQFVHGEEAKIAANLVCSGFLRAVVVKEAHMPAPFST